MTDFTFSVLLPVYAGVSAPHFRRCLASVYGQSLPPNEVVIVEDGPLPSQLHLVLEEFEVARPRPVRVAIAVNGGAGVSNQAGLEAASCTWIAKMDADDVNYPHRFATQFAALASGSYDVLGAAMAEFVDDEQAITGIRACPESHEAIAQRMRTNSPINHPTVVYRRELALSVGGYSDMRYMQDYDLFARMLAAGAIMHNLPEPLVLFRANPHVLSRRSSWNIIALERRLQRNLRSYGIVGPIRQRFNLVSRVAYRMLPRPLLQWAYRRLFLSKPPARDARKKSP